MTMLELGIDIISIDRFRDAAGKNKALQERILTDREIKYCQSKKNYIENMAGRFAAKEALYKAANKVLGPIALKDIEILSGGESPRVSPDCLLGRELRKKGLACRVSISHNGSYAVANAVLFKGDM